MHLASAALVRNPNESLLMDALMELGHGGLTELPTGRVAGRQIRSARRVGPLLGWRVPSRLGSSVGRATHS